MHNHQILIGRSQIATSHHATQELSHLVRKILRRERYERLLAKLREAATYCLATLAVSGVLLGSVYLFLVQLAEHGW